MPLACPLPRGAKGVGELISRFEGCKVWRRERSRVGVASASLFDDEETGMDGRDFGEGNAWEDRCNEGDDIEPCRIDGATKGVKPAARTLSTRSLSTGIDRSGEGVSRPRLNVTLDSSRRSIPGRSFSLRTGWVESFSFPFPFLMVMVANSSAGGAGTFLERVAVRMLCSRDERIRPNALVEGGGGDVEVEASESSDGCGEREDDA